MIGCASVHAKRTPFFSAFRVCRQIDFSDELYIQTLKALDESTPVEKLQTLVKEAAPTDTEVYVRLLPHIRDALNTKCFLDELSEVGMVLAQVQKHIREIDPTASANEGTRGSPLCGISGQSSRSSCPASLLRCLRSNQRV